MIYGYCRVSRKTQNIERQIRNIKDYCNEAVIVQEVFTRTTMNRAEWQKLIKKVKKGDTIVFDSVSRMSGNAVEGFEAYENLFNAGVSLVFLKEPHINTETYQKAFNNSLELTGNNIDFILDGINKYLLALAKEQIIIAFQQSEKEVEDLHQRTKEGIETARLNGKQIGQKQGVKLTTKKSITAKQKIKEYSKDFDGVLDDIDVMKLAGISRNSYYKYKKELRESI